MFYQKCKNMLSVFLVTLFFIPHLVFAYSDYVIPGGENIGIQIKTNGVLIVGLYKVNNTYPGRDAGLKLGDKIIAVNKQPITNINDLVLAINKAEQSQKIILEYERYAKTYTTSLQLVMNDDQVYKTGLYVKDTINGIGTLTYIDPETKMYGALGHEIMEKTTGQKVAVGTGKIFKAEVLNIERSNNGSPGEKNARFYSNRIYGEINENKTTGIFGPYTALIPTKKAYKVAEPSLVKPGSATILTVIKDEVVEEFDIEILKVNLQAQQHKNILFNITDLKLLEATGGIVQGMSGSPIIQDEMIIGAVTHVVVNETTKGYGIFIKHMLEASEN